MKWILSVLIVVSLYNNTFARDIFVGGAGASDSNPGTATQPFATVQMAASVAVAGDVVNIRSGTYRETIAPANSGVTFRNDNGATVTISGLNEVTTPWTVHSGQIYKTTITLPVNGFQQYLTSNTTILANQIFKDGVMQFQARWPKISSLNDLLDRSKFRHHSSMSSFGQTSLTDSGLPAGNFTGGSIFMAGWYISQTRPITSHSGSTLNYSATIADAKFRKWYYITNDLDLLTTAKEWHYESNTLYFWQSGGGSPAGVEYKARNWGFDLRGKDNVKIIGLHFIGCEPATGDTGTDGTIIDNIRAQYTNHSFIQNDPDIIYNVPKQTGIKLLGNNNTVKNSEFKYTASQLIWAGPGTIIENNLASDISYEGNFGAFVTPYQGADNIKIMHNTVSRVGRSMVDFGWDGQVAGASHQNMEIGYNDFHDFLMINTDGGATYGARGIDLTGLRIHHNWIHDNSVGNAWQNPANYDGIHTGIYFDQASGPSTVDHNVIWNGGMADFYSEIATPSIPGGRITLLYNNTFASLYPDTRESYKCPHNTPSDVLRNNIFLNTVNINFGGSPGNIANCILKTTDPKFVGPLRTGLGYKVQSTSPAINAGVIIPGITDGSVGAPDIGAYEFGGPDWIPGYTPVPTTTPPANTSPTGSITAPSNNTSFAQGAPINITATAADANGTVTRVEFFDGTTKLGEDTSTPYSFNWTNAAAGTHTLTIRVTDNENATTTSTAVTITVTANASPTVAITAPANNAQVAVGTPISITATAADANGTVTKVEFFDGTTKLGEDLSSPYTFAWTNAAAGAHVLTAKATDDQNNVTTSSAVNITLTAANTPPTVSITSPSNNAQFAIGASINITATAADANGSVTKVEFFNGTTKLGEDLTSPYTFAWNGAPAGTYNLTARATDNGALVTTSTAINVTVAAAMNTPPVVSLTSPANNAQFTPGSPITLTATASDPNGTVTKVEFFDGTTKLGEDLTSPYTFAWSNAAAGTHVITVKATDNGSVVTTSAAVTITVTASINTLPVVSITGPLNNAQFISGSAITITATASDANGTVTKVEFFNGTTKLGEDTSSPYSFGWNNAPAGTHTLTARATDNANAVTTSAPVSVTVNANTTPNVSITAPANNATLTSGTAITITATATVPSGSITKVEFFDGTTKLGEDATSPYNFVWNGAATGTHSLTARATNNTNATATSTAVNITVTAANAPPVVSLTSPTNNAQFTVGSAINLTANATDPNGSVTKVEFFRGTTKLGEDLTSPYTFAWNNATAGTYSLTARATDNGALVTTSTAINVTVAAAMNTPPVVSLTSPANNAQFTPGSPITLTATASDPNGTVTKVEFFDGTTKLGEDLTSPYTFAWSNAAAGTHVITVKATDNGSVVTTSAAVTITVTASTNTLPVVSITGPLNNAQFISGSAITITATASDANGTVTKVEFFDGPTKVGEDLTSPYSFIWTNVSSGNHALTASATDKLGGIASSATINISVADPERPTAEAGEDVFLTLPENSLTLEPSVSSDVPVEYSWTQVEGPNTAAISAPTAQAISVSDLIEGMYIFEFTVTNANGLSTSDRISVTVVAGSTAAVSQSGIPRFFSPNDDGTGDYWEWSDVEPFEDSLLSVYNRPGQKVYETVSYKNTWDGKMDGQPLQAGDYYYIIQMADATDIKGAVQIIR